MTWNFYRSHLRGTVWCKHKVCLLVEHSQCPISNEKKDPLSPAAAGRAAHCARASQGRFILTLCSQAAGLALLVLPVLAVR